MGRARQLAGGSNGGSQLRGLGRLRRPLSLFLLLNVAQGHHAAPVGARRQVHWSAQWRPHGGRCSQFVASITHSVSTWITHRARCRSTCTFTPFTATHLPPLMPPRAAFAQPPAGVSTPGGAAAAAAASSAARRAALSASSCWISNSVLPAPHEPPSEAGGTDGQQMAVHPSSSYLPI